MIASMEPPPNLERASVAEPTEIGSLAVADPAAVFWPMTSVRKACPVVPAREESIST